jgi:hypothetical protein
VADKIHLCQMIFIHFSGLRYDFFRFIGICLFSSQNEPNYLSWCWEELNEVRILKKMKSWIFGEFYDVLKKIHPSWTNISSWSNFNFLERKFTSSIDLQLLHMILQLLQMMFIYCRWMTIFYLQQWKGSRGTKFIQDGWLLWNIRLNFTQYSKFRNHSEFSYLIKSSP